MNIEDRFAYIKKEYGDAAERIWREIAKLPNFNYEYLTDDKIFLCITQRGFMSSFKASELGLYDKSFCRADFKGLEGEKIAVDVINKNALDINEINVRGKRKFWIGIDKNGALTFEDDYKSVYPDGYTPKISEHDYETIKINDEGNIEHSYESSRSEYTSNMTRNIKAKSVIKNDRATGIKLLQQQDASTQIYEGRNLVDFKSNSTTSKLNPDFATVSYTFSNSNLIGGKITKNESTEVTLYSGGYIPMDDFNMSGFLEQPGEKVKLGTPEAEEKINAHRIKLAKGGLKNQGKLPIKMIEQLPDDIKGNINTAGQDISISDYTQLYYEIMQRKDGPDKMRKMTQSIEHTLGKHSEKVKDSEPNLE